MVIGINALGALSQDTGGRTYIVNMAKTLQHEVKEHSIFFFMSEGESHILDIHQPNFRIIEIKRSADSYRRIFAEHFILPFLIRKHKIDVMYFPGNFASYYCPVPYILAIRSMLAYNVDLESSVSKSRNIYRKFLYPKSARNARHIITPSEHTKNEIIRFLHVHPERISVIPHGIDVSIFGSPRDDHSARILFQQLDVKTPYILYVSALWEYKNQDMLIRAFHKLVQKNQINHQLVLVGRGMNSYESYATKLKSLVSMLNLDSYVRFIDFLPHDQLRHVYQHSDVYVFPSAMESFGNSIFEAMAAGIPVVCSNTHGFSTLVGDAALMVNPYNTDELATAISRVLSEPQIRNILVSNGKSLTNSLSWQLCFDKTLHHILNAQKVT